jgi:hypothetical protein
MHALQVAGRFCYGVMALSGATFAFWTTLGPTLFPAVVPAGGPLLLGLQLACNVLANQLSSNMATIIKLQLFEMHLLLELLWDMIVYSF